MNFNLLKRKIKSQKNNIKTNTHTNKNTREKSLGRSMVEMLGVLAIIGVLSIGGIQGYTIAMRRYRANEVINLATKYAMTIYTSCQNQIVNGLSFKLDESEVARIDESGQWHCRRILFDDTDMKNTLNYATIDRTSSYIYGSKSGSNIMSINNIDYIYIVVVVSTKELCQTIASINGNTENTPGNLGNKDVYPNCEENMNGSYFWDNDPFYKELKKNQYVTYITIPVLDGNQTPPRYSSYSSDW